MKVALMLGALLLAGCARPPQFDVFGQVPAFELTSQSAQMFDSKALEGHVWVADFFFTSCPGPCPLMSKKLADVQRQTADLPGVKIVSFTVDPATDTPPVLAEYAKRYVADPARWFFLTGEQAKLDALGRDGFKLNPVDGSNVHSTRFVLVDQRMQIRGYYSSDEQGVIAKLVHDIRALAGDKT